MSELSEPLDQGDITLVNDTWDQLSGKLGPQYTECYSYRRRLLATEHPGAAGNTGSNSSKNSQIISSTCPGLNISAEDYLLNAFGIVPSPCPFGTCTCAECTALARDQADARFQFNSQRLEPGSSLNELEIDELNVSALPIPMCPAVPYSLI